MIVLPLFSLGWIAYEQLKITAQQTIVKQMDTLLNQTALQVESFQQTALANVELFSGSTMLNSYLLADEDDRYDLLQLPLLKLFASYNRAYPHYYEIRVLLPDGYEDARYTATDLDNITEEEGETFYFQTMQQASVPIYTTFLKNPDDKENVFLVAKRLQFVDRRIDGPDAHIHKLRGYLVITVNLDFMAKQVKNNLIGKSGIIFFTDNQGKILFHPIKSQIDQVLPTNLLESVKQETFFKGQYQHQTLLFQGQRLHKNLFLVAALPEQELLVASQTLGKVVAAITFVAIVITMTLLLFLLNYLLIYPIQKLSQAAQAIENGNLDTRITIPTKDEIGMLAAQFNQMALGLKKTDELKNEFLANTSHELKTPLNGIIGIAESLLDGVSGELPDNTKMNLAMIVSSGRRLATLVNDILDLSRLRHKKLNLQLKPIDLRENVAIVLMLNQHLLAQKKLQLINAVPDDLPAAYADENRVQQILHNLIGNAIKFTESGHIEVSAKVFSILKDGVANPVQHKFSILKDGVANPVQHIEVTDSDNWLQITVSDTGIGIPADKLDSIFQHFEQADGGTAREYGGTGLGLAVTKQLVNLHGSELLVSSTVGEGSQFTFSLPVSEQLAQTTYDNLNIAIQSDEIPELIDSNLSGDGFKIFIVDDEPINRQVFINHLRLENYAIVQAASGIEALEKIENGYHPDLILLDVMMPKMSGFEFCQKLREYYCAVELPVLMVTAKNQVVDIVEGFGIGANDYLTKPVSKNELLSRIRTHLQLAQINVAYNHFVPHQFLQMLNKKSIIEVQLGENVQREMTILFADIRDFTSLSEEITPQDNFNFINAYLSRMEPVISQHHGFVDKYIGDAIMALFPSADDAVQAAIGMLKRLAKYNLTRGRPGRPIINIGVGLNTGLLMLGTIGGENRMDGTVISDAVNLASRVEGLTKVYGTPLLITEHTYKKLADPFQYLMRVIDATKVKGKSSVVTVYEVFDADPPDTIAFKNETIEDFEPGFVLYHSDEVADAKPLFENVLQVNPHDIAAQIYLERCQKILSMTMPENPTIMVVDDMPFNIKVLTTLLGKNNFKVLVAENGKAALEVIKITLPHLILLDIMMPEMDGFEVCKLLKADPKTQDIPIIFITALSEPEDKVKGFKLGAVDYITKPFRREEVLARVKTHLHLSHLQQRASWCIKNEI